MSKRQVEDRIYGGAVQKVITDTIIKVVIFDVLIIFVFLLLSKAIKEDSTGFFFIFTALEIGFSIVYCIIAIEDNIKLEKAKISKKIVDARIPINKYIEVFPKKGHLKYEKFFEKEIPIQLKGRYYAIIQEETSFIKIFIKLKTNEKYIFLESIPKEAFVESYIIVEKEKPKE